MFEIIFILIINENVTNDKKLSNNGKYLRIGGLFRILL